MRLTEYKCDVCSASKGQTNHWWILDINLTSQIFAMRPWSEGLADERLVWELKRHHICSGGCAVIKLSEYLRSVK